MKELVKVKDGLEREKKVEVGSFVTIDDFNDYIDAYVVKEISDAKAIIYGLALTEGKDDVYIKSISIDLDSLIPIDHSFINTNGLLDTVQKQVLNPAIKPILYTDEIYNIKRAM